MPVLRKREVITESVLEIKTSALRSNLLGSARKVADQILQFLPNQKDMSILNYQSCQNQYN